MLCLFPLQKGEIDGERNSKTMSENEKDKKETRVQGSGTTASSSKKTDEYEKICYMCRRPESKAGKMVEMPGNISVCTDCMQKTFDSIQGSTGMQYADLMKLSNLNFMNLSDLHGEIPQRQKLKKKKPKEEKKVDPVFNIQKMPAPHKIKEKLDDYVVGQEHAKKVISVAVRSEERRVGKECRL